ncbi:MAG: type II toxin-antitoxin system RelE/ParE family toxin [Methyloceanibacter sp.]
MKASSLSYGRSSVSGHEVFYEAPSNKQLQPTPNCSSRIQRVVLSRQVGRSIVMLHQFTKKSDKTPRKELEIARQRMKEVKDE